MLTRIYRRVIVSRLCLRPHLCWQGPRYSQGRICGALGEILEVGERRRRRLIKEPETDQHSSLFLVFEIKRLTSIRRVVLFSRRLE